jgi:hypothetical protein
MPFCMLIYPNYRLPPRLIDFAVQRHRTIFRSALSIREGQGRRPSNMRPAIARIVVSTHPLSGSKCRMRNPTATKVPPSPSRTRHALGIAAKFTGVPYRMRNHWGSSITPNPVSIKPRYQIRSATEVGATNTRAGEAIMKMTSKKMPPILCPRVRCRQSNICPLTMKFSDAGFVAPETKLIYPDPAVAQVVTSCHGSTHQNRHEKGYRRRGAQLTTGHHVYVTCRTGDYVPVRGAGSTH